MFSPNVNHVSTNICASVQCVKSNLCPCPIIIIENWGSICFATINNRKQKTKLSAL